MNWALIQGQRKFVTYLFRYTPGMDDGDIIAFRAFDITEADDIMTLHAKNRAVMCALLHERWAEIASGQVKTFPQPSSRATYYPKRTAADGAIDWRLSSDEICRLVRAVAPPYPGGVTEINGESVAILNAQSFDSGLFEPSTPPGTVLDVQVSLNRLVIKSGDGSVLVSHLSSSLDLASIAVGDVARSADSTAILRDIKSRYPDFISGDQKEI